MATDLNRYLDQEPTKELIRKAYAEGKSPYMVFIAHCEENKIQRTEIVNVVFWKCVEEVREENNA